MPELCIRRPTDSQRKKMVAKFMYGLGAVEGIAKKLSYVKIQAISTDSACGHGCRHCGNCTRPKNQSDPILLEDIKLAKGRGLIGWGAQLTGGEPLDHPQIEDIFDMLADLGMFLGATNGFSERERWYEQHKEILEVAGRFISEVSFHTFDRGK